MSDAKKPKETTSKKTEAVKPKTEVTTKAVDSKTEASETKTDTAPKKQGMGEGQKAVTKAYKDNWNDIFGKKKKR
jgi:hypothetical protein